MTARQSLPDGLQTGPIHLVSVLTAAKVETLDADSRRLINSADQRKPAATKGFPAAAPFVRLGGWGVSKSIVVTTVPVNRKAGTEFET